MTEMSMFNYTIKHTPGKANGTADYLSKYPVEKQKSSDEDDVAHICHVNVTRVSTELGLLDPIVRGARMGVIGVSCDQENILIEDAATKAFQSYSNEELNKWQKEDAHIFKVREIISEKIRVSKNEINQFSVSAKTLLRQRKRFLIVKDLVN